MNELFFPALGAAIVFLVAAPLLTVTARALLDALPTAETIGAHSSPWRLALILAPTFGPALWLVSAIIHQVEEPGPLTACIVDHLGGEVCRDLLLFGLVLASTLSLGALRELRQPRRRATPLTSDSSPSAARVRDIVAEHPGLGAFAARIHVVHQGAAPACTRGLLRPRVEVERALVEQLSDEELCATLLHEVEHAREHDPMRLFVARVALGSNPLGRLLEAALARYCFSREALCDLRAVQRGADPLALARSIVAAANPDARPTIHPALGGAGIAGVRARVQLLLGYASAPPAPLEAQSRVGFVSTLVPLLVASPHLLGTAPLDLLHHHVERAALLLGLG